MTSMTRSPKTRLRSATVVFQPTRMADVSEMLSLIRAFGEGNVDLREIEILEKAVRESRLHTFFDLATDQMVGFAGVYPYQAGPRLLNELGGSLVIPSFRSRGIADASVAMRCLLSMHAHPGSVCVSELYHESVKSKAVLERHGFREVIPDQWQIEHARAASEKPVRHMELGDPPIPAAANFLLRLAEGAPICRNEAETCIRFGDAYSFSERLGKKMLADIARGDLTSIRPDREVERSPALEVVCDIPPSAPE